MKNICTLLLFKERRIESQQIHSDLFEDKDGIEDIFLSFAFVHDELCQTVNGKWS